MASCAYSAVMPRLAWMPSERVVMFAGGKLENDAPGRAMRISRSPLRPGKYLSTSLTVSGSRSEHDRYVSSTTITFRNNQLLRVDDVSILDDVASNSGIVLDGLGRDGLKARNLRIDSRLVAPKTSEDLLPCDCVRLVDGVVRTVCRAVIAIKTESAAAAEIALGDSACNQILFNDSRRAQQGANGSCAGTSADLQILADVNCS